VIRKVVATIIRHSKRYYTEKEVGAASGFAEPGYFDDTPHNPTWEGKQKKSS
jgi:hypothetical protein